MRKVITIISFSFWGIVAVGQTTTSEAFSKSYTYEVNKEYSNAIAAMNKVYSAESYSINLRLGWLNYLAGEYVNSQSYYKKAIGLEPKSIEARLGYAYPASAMENWNDVVKIYEEILAIDVNNSVVNYRMGSIFYYRKDYTKATNYLQRVLNLYPFDYDSNYLLGQIEIIQGKIKEAKIHLNRALEYNPSSSEVKKLLSTL